MADLDDFFAKKDRKRSKQARRQGNADEPQNPKRPEEPRKSQESEEAPQHRDQHQHQHQQAAPPQEDEWREVEVAKKADYTGLKIQHLAPGQESAAGYDGNQGQGGNHGHGANSSANAKGPWNKAAESHEPVREEREPPAPSDVTLPPPPSSKAYISPAMRNRPAGYQDAPLRNKYGRPLAPDINSQEFFPVLGEGRKAHNPGSAGPHGHWSEPGRGAPPSSRPPPRELSLGNRYNSLTHDS